MKSRENDSYEKVCFYPQYLFKYTRNGESSSRRRQSTVEFPYIHIHSVSYFLFSKPPFLVWTNLTFAEWKIHE